MRSVVRAIIRIALIFLFLQSLFTIIRYIDTIWVSESVPHDWDYYRFYLIFIGTEAVIVLCIWVLWWKTDWIARFFVGETSDDSLVISTSNLDLFIVAIRVLGIFFIITALCDITGELVYYSIYDQLVPGVENPELTPNLIRSLSTNGATLIFGLILSFSGTRLFKPISNLWSTGSISRKTPDSED